jgi:hypothetical protein
MTAMAWRLLDGHRPLPRNALDMGMIVVTLINMADLLISTTKRVATTSFMVTGIEISVAVVIETTLMETTVDTTMGMMMVINGPATLVGHGK